MPLNFSYALRVFSARQRSGAAAGKRWLASRARSAMFFAAAVWIASQLALSATIEHWLPELRDPEFGNKLTRLRSRIEENPSRPLIVVLGSSRSDFGICPREMARLSDQPGPPPQLFNFAILGGGPITEAVMLNELLAWGVRPDGLLVELNGVLLNQTPGFQEENWIQAERLGRAGLQTLQRYSSHPEELGRRWLRARLVPCYSSRHLLLSRIAPRWVEPIHRQDRCRQPDEDGWLELEPREVSLAERRRRVESQLNIYALPFRDFAVSPRADAALRDLLDVCGKRRIAVGLVLMPEASEFRSARGAEGARCFEAYAARLCGEYSVPLIDAQDWTTDSDFADGDHLLPDAARRFSRRLHASAARFVAEAGKGPASAERIVCQPDRMVR